MINQAIKQREVTRFQGKGLSLRLPLIGCALLLSLTVLHFLAGWPFDVGRIVQTVGIASLAVGIYLLGVLRNYAILRDDVLEVRIWLRPLTTFRIPYHAITSYEVEQPNDLVIVKFKDENGDEQFISFIARSPGASTQLVSKLQNHLPA